MDWLCPCKPKERTVLQEYVLAIHNDPSKIHPKSNEEVNIGRATAKQTKQKIQKQQERLKLRKELDLKTNKDGYLSIEDLRKQKPSAVFRKIKKSNYDEVLQACIKKNQKWTDPDFDYSVNYKWKRITQKMPNATFMSQAVEPTAIQQGLFNNCYWMSAISVLAEREYRVKSLFESLEVNKYGVYMCKLVHNGVYQEVIVDDLFPFNDNGNYACSKPNGTDFWVLVIEKCWAKLFGGYAQTDFGFNTEALWALTGSPVLGQYPTSEFRGDTVRKRSFFKKLMGHYERNHLITCSVDVYVDYKAERKTSNKYGLQAAHSYSVLGIFETIYDGHRIELLQIRNPVGRTKTVDFYYPDLPFNADDQFWKVISPEEKDRLEYWRIKSKNNQGIFYVDWTDFLDNFNQIAIAQLDDNANYLYETVRMDGEKPQYLSIKITTCDSFHLIVAQQDSSRNGPMDPRLKKEIKYAVVRVLVAAVKHDYNNEVFYVYQKSKSLIPDETKSNYLDVDLGTLPHGEYIARISISSLDAPVNDLTLGYYGPGGFAVKKIDGIDDNDFLCKTLLSRARSLNPTSPLRTQLKDAEGWCCIEKIAEGNFCYVAYHIDSSSKYQKYVISIDESDLALDTKDHKGIYFEGHWRGNSLRQVVKRGQQVLFPYNYDNWLGDKDKYPVSVVDDRPYPKPDFRPLIE